MTVNLRGVNKQYHDSIESYRALALTKPVVVVRTYNGTPICDPVWSYTQRMHTCRHTMYAHERHSSEAVELLGLPTTNVNASFVFKFGKMSTERYWSFCTLPEWSLSECVCVSITYMYMYMCIQCVCMHMDSCTVWLCVQGWPYPPRTFFYRDNRSSRVSSLFSAVLGRHSCTKSMGMC